MCVSTLQALPRGISMHYKKRFHNINSERCLWQLNRDQNRILEGYSMLSQMDASNSSSWGVLVRSIRISYTPRNNTQNI